MLKIFLYNLKDVTASVGFSLKVTLIIFNLLVEETASDISNN